MFCKNGMAEDREMLPGVHLQTLVHGEKTLMGRFILNQGAKIPAHRHPHEQTGILVSGQLRLGIDTEVFEVTVGDSWCIPENVEHSVEIIVDSEVIEVFSPVREDYLSGK